MAQSALTMKQARLELPPQKLVGNVSTQWNSTAEMTFWNSTQLCQLCLWKVRRENVLTASEITNLKHDYCVCFEAIYWNHCHGLRREERDHITNAADSSSTEKQDCQKDISMPAGTGQVSRVNGPTKLSAKLYTPFCAVLELDWISRIPSSTGDVRRSLRAQVK